MVFGLFEVIKWEKELNESMDIRNQGMSDADPGLLRIQIINR